mmetsp:Transcript_23348/g.28775  ORF Transcript_23348/g.28775 Transcript_23348/m.28775 type:complete len:265 (-) Transcript_23348:1346-2140(-)
MVYGDYHRHCLQLFLRETAIDLEDFKKHLREYESNENLNLSDYSSHDGFDMLVGEINNHLNKYTMQLRVRKRTAVELDGKTYWVLVNTKSDPVAQQATTLKEWQVRLFKQFCDMIVSSELGVITSTQAISTAQRMRQVSATEVEDLLEQLCKEKWLYEDDEKNGRFTVGIRTLVELEALLQEFGAFECPVTSQISVATNKYRRWLKQKNFDLPSRLNNRQQEQPEEDDGSEESDENESETEKKQADNSQTEPVSNCRSKKRRSS